MATKKTQSKMPEISADRPISSAKEDILGRKPFAAGLAKRIGTWDARESLVTALCGEWGCGKTSLKNMVIEELAQQSQSKIKVMEFNPWEISGHNSLTPAFFRDLSLTIAPAEDAKEEERQAAKRLSKYAKQASFGSFLFKSLGLAATSYDPLVSQSLLAVGSTADQVKDLTNAASAAQHIETEPSSLSEVKRQLIADMHKLNNPILIVIDDIDRLTSNEIREVFQLVKANANLPNLIYLLLFDRGIVANALDSVSGSKGYQFLDKIVQALFNVPQPNLEKIHKVLFLGMAKCLSQKGVNDGWDKYRWSDVWLGGLSPYFQNLRSIYRFLSSFSFQVSQMRNNNTFELNPLDLLILEVLRLFEPNLYEALLSRKNELTGKSRDLFPAPEGERLNEMKETVDQLLLHANRNSHQRLRIIIGSLFPALFTLDLKEGVLLTQLRVGHKAIFDRYFTSSLPHDDVSQADVNALQDNLKKPVKFTKLCETLKRRGKLALAINRLVARENDLNSSIFPEAITSLIDAAEIFPYNVNIDPFATDSLDYASHFIRHTLLQVDDAEVRSNLMYMGIEAAKGLLLAVKLVSWNQRLPERSDHDWLLTTEDWLKIQSIVIERIRDYAKTGRLRSLPELSYVLWRWKDWSGEKEVSEWINSLLHKEEDALWVLRTFMSEGTRTSSKVTIRRYIILSDLSLFCDIEKIEHLTDGYSLDKLKGDDKHALRAFRFSLKCRDEGKPDNYCRDSHRGIKELEEVL